MDSKLSNVVTAISRFAHSSNPQDEMFVVDFSDHATVQSLGGKTSQATLPKSKKALRFPQAGEPLSTMPWRLGSITRLAHWQKKILVVISDGGDNASWYKHSQVLAKARESQVAIYSVGLVDDLGEEENPEILEQLCKDTGGVAFFPCSDFAVIDSTAHIARDLREQYMLGFVPDKQSDAVSFRKIQVHVVAPQHGKLRVRARPGYSVGARNELAPKSERDTP